MVGAATLTSGVATAQSQSKNEPKTGLRLDQLQLASPESMFFRAEGPHTPLIGVEFAAAATFEYSKGSLRQYGIDVDGNREKIANLVEHALIARIGASITPLHWLAFDLSVPFALFETGDITYRGKGFDATPPSYGGIRINDIGSAPGIGDIRLGVHFRPIDTQKFGLIIGARAWAPIGSTSSYMSEHAPRAELDIGVAGELPRLLYGCTLNVSPAIVAAIANRSREDRFNASCALHIKVGDKITLGLEPTFQMVRVNDRVPTAGTKPAVAETGFDFIVEPLAAFRLKLGGFRLGAAVGPAFGGSPGAADIRAMLTAGYVGLGKPPKEKPLPPADRDLDKIPDKEDACPDEAGPPSKDPTKNGCPAKDRDGDGIRDDEDFCPDRAGIPYPDPKANGCPDSDNDSLPDPIDECKNEPGAPPKGCPKFARLGSGGFTIDPPLDFGNSDKLSANNRAALEEVAATMRANPKVEQISISIGTKGSKAAMNDKRAQEILAVLRSANLDPNRYEVVLRDDIKGGVVTVRISKQ